jgi:hypothetical protein
MIKSKNLEEYKDRILGLANGNGAMRDEARKEFLWYGMGMEWALDNSIIDEPEHKYAVGDRFRINPTGFIFEITGYLPALKYRTQDGFLSIAHSEQYINLYCTKIEREPNLDEVYSS